MFKILCVSVLFFLVYSCVSIPCQVPKERKGTVDYYSPSRPTEEELNDCAKQKIH